MSTITRMLTSLFALRCVGAASEKQDVFDAAALELDDSDDALSLLQRDVVRKANLQDLHLFSKDQLLGEVQRREMSEDTSQMFEPASNVSGKQFPMVIIGAGPAGMSAAIYAARAGLRPLVLSPFFGGQLMGKGVDIENFAGVFGRKTTGVGLVNIMRQQARSFDTRFAGAQVLSVNFTAKPLELFLQGAKEPVRAQTVVLASGTTARWLKAPNEEKYKGRGISACATCDGFFFRNREVIIVGGGDSAMEDALHLNHFASKITIIHRRDRLRASKILADRVLKLPKVSVKWNTTVESFLGNDRLTHVMLKNLNGTVEKFKTDGAFEAIGQIPQTSFLRTHLDMDHAGYVSVKSGSFTATSVPGVFAAGDVADHIYRQAITASGTGAMAALDAERYVNSGGKQL